MSSNGFDVIESGITSQSTCENSKFFGIEINGLALDIGFINYRNRLFVIITQYGKLGSLYSVQTNTLPSDDKAPVYDIRTVFGEDREEYDVTARALADILPDSKPTLLSISIKDLTYPLVKTLRKIVLDNKIW